MPALDVCLMLCSAVIFISGTQIYTTGVVQAFLEITAVIAVS